jgi:hypothetical protein
LPDPLGIERKSLIQVKNARALARVILESAEKFPWTLQGLGMLRLHLGDNTRLHVWDHRFAFPGASPIHDHLQWGLHSTVLSGQLRNTRFLEDPAGDPFQYAVLKAGVGCFFKDGPHPIRLRRHTPEVYEAGSCYEQKPEEIHETSATPGTVTIMRKTPTADGESARVFWPAGSEWGSAEPRPATPEEIKQIVGTALERWTATTDLRVSLPIVKP